MSIGTLRMTALPECLIESPAQTSRLIDSPETPPNPPSRAASTADGDALSAVLRAVRLRGAIYFLVDATPPWVAEAPRGRDLAPLIMPGVQHLIEYHVVTRGSCFGGLPGETPIELHAGDVIVFPQGDAHVMSSAPHMRDPRPLDEFRELTNGRPPFALQMGAAGAAQAEVVCGFLGCDARPFNPLLAALPRVLCVRAGEGPQSGTLAALVELALIESRERRAGGDCVLARLSELLFVEVVRRHLQALPPQQEGWLAGLRDPLVGRALTLLHARPAKEWTLEDLAREAATSRSVLADRFRRYVGDSPMQYLAQWRMQLAAGLLENADANVASVAREVGYGSEAAFSRAFKKLVGVPPTAWRLSAGA